MTGVLWPPAVIMDRGNLAGVCLLLVVSLAAPAGFALASADLTKTPLSRFETLEQNAAARHLYPELGFREVGRKRYFFMDL